MQKTAPKILVLDAMWNKTLAAVRSLGRKGFYLAVGEKTMFATAIFSRYCSRRLTYPSPLSKPDEFLDWLLNEVKRNNYDMVLPTELETQQIILRNREELEKYTRVPFADYTLTANVQNKAWLMKYAETNGYPCPKTYFIENGEQRAENRDEPLTTSQDVVKGENHYLNPQLSALASISEYPLVIKPRESSGSRGIMYVKKPSDFPAAFKKVQGRYPLPIVQEYIPHGGAYGVGALFNRNSEPKAAFVYKRLREYPVTGGPSTLRESVKNDEIKEIALNLLKSLKWTGIAMVEFRVDARDGRPKLMEINPRFWGSLQLAIISGMDFPYLLYKMAVDGDIEPVWDYRVGVRCRWLIPGDILHFIYNPQRLRLTPSFFTRTDGDDIISAIDPMPLVGRLSSVLTFLSDRDMRKLLFR